MNNAQQPPPESTSDAIAIWRAGVDAVGAENLISNNISFDHRNSCRLLSIGDYEWELDNLRSILVVGAGKAAAAMAVGLERTFTSLGIPWRGVVNVPAGTEQPLQHIQLLVARPAGINEPTAAGVLGSERIMELVRAAGPDDGCIVLLSGGGSALLPLPIDGITLEDKLAVTRRSESGANIEQLNVVRKHLSAIKGGKLAAACGARWLHTLVISDVLGDPLDLIASGPTVADPSTPAEALRVLQLFDPQRQLPASIYQVLESSIGRNLANRPLPIESDRFAERIDEISILGNNAVAVDAAGIEAEFRGYNHAMVSARRCEGSAEEVGWHLAEMAVTMATASLDGLSVQPNCLISGGEPVVTLAPAEVRGIGGRNQQLVLAALDRLMREPDSVQRMIRDRVVLLSAGTDGEDGPTDAAGACLNGEIWRRAEALNLSPHDFLTSNNAYRFFEQTGGLFKTGPTGTNVCDLRVITIGDV